MELPPLHHRRGVLDPGGDEDVLECNTLQRAPAPAPLALMDSGGDPELVPYSNASWEAVPAPDDIDACDMGFASHRDKKRGANQGVSPPKRQGRRNREKRASHDSREDPLREAAAWHHSAGVFEPEDVVRKRSKSKSRKD